MNGEEQIDSPSPFGMIYCFGIRNWEEWVVISCLYQAIKGNNDQKVNSNMRSGWLYHACIRQ